MFWCGHRTTPSLLCFSAGYSTTEFDLSLGAICMRSPILSASICLSMRSQQQGKDHRCDKTLHMRITCTLQYTSWPVDEWQGQWLRGLVMRKSMPASYEWFRDSFLSLLKQVARRDTMWLKGTILPRWHLTANSSVNLHYIKGMLTPTVHTVSVPCHATSVTRNWTQTTKHTCIFPIHLGTSLSAYCSDHPLITLHMSYVICNA